MSEPTPQEIIASLTGLRVGLEKMAENARTLPGPIWQVVAEVVQGQVHTFKGLESLLEAVVERGGAL